MKSAFGSWNRNGRRAYYLYGGALLVLAVVAGGWWWNLRTGSHVRYSTVSVSRGPVTDVVTATGTVNPELNIIVGTYVSGVIKELYCDYNTRVTKGQVCAKIDPRPFETAVKQARASLAIAKAQLQKDSANLAYAKITYERNLRLVTTHAVSQDSVDDAKSDYEQAQAQIAFDEATIEHRRAVLDAAQVKLGYTDIVSPVEGTVVSRNVTVGQTVAASFQTPTLFLIASDLTRMQVDTNVSQGDIGDLKISAQATFNVDAFPKRTFQGSVSQIRQSPQTVKNVVTFDVVLSVDNSDLALKPGMTATTRIVVDQRDNVLRVPRQALRFVPSDRASGSRAPRTRAPSGDLQSHVWVLRAGKPAAIPVVAGLDDGSFVEIASGALAVGDQVIVAERSTAGRAMPRPRL